MPLPAFGASGRISGGIYDPPVRSGFFYTLRECLARVLMREFTIFVTRGVDYCATLKTYILAIQVETISTHNTNRFIAHSVLLA